VESSWLAGAGLGASAEDWAERREELRKKDRRLRKEIEQLEAEGEPDRELMERMKTVSADIQAFLAENQARWP
jgi:predicted  nucleic acid-binding Zn-ribbon protein